MIDTHCHLDACEGPVAELIERARAASVRRMLAIGTNGDSSRHALRMADTHDEVFVAVGWHPHDADSFDDGALAELAQLSGHQKVRAIGEAGLDYHRDYSTRDEQRETFAAQIELANELHLPLVVHTRDAADETFELLEVHAEGIPVIMHCFSLSDRVDDCIERGYYCSFAGNVTYPNATELQEAARRVPDELLLIETDSPYLAPQAHRGNANEPSFVGATAVFLADLRGVGYEELERRLESNAEWIFRW